MKKRRGMTILEVVIAFVLMGIIASLVSGVMTGAYAMSAKLKKMPNAYYGAQAEVEAYMKVLKEFAEAERNLEELEKDGEESEKSAAKATLAEKKAAKDKIKDYHYKEPVEVFGRTVEVYRCSQTVSKDGVTFFLCGGVSVAGRLKRPIPKIEKVEIKYFASDTESKLRTEVYYDGIGKTLRGTKSPVTNKAGKKVGDFVAQYAKRNVDYLKAEFYQWYVSSGVSHAMPFEEATVEGGEYDDINTSYPMDFTPIAGETDLSINITDKYKGKFLVLVVTPLSKSGATGEPVASNMVYINSLPKLSNGRYTCVIDPSWVKVKAWSKSPVSDGFINLSGDKWEKLKSLQLPGMADDAGEIEFSGTPKMNVMGDQISASNANSLGVVSRFIEYTGGSRGEIETKRDTKYVFMVVKSNEVDEAIKKLKENSADKPILKMADGLIVEDAWPKSAKSKTGWSIVKGSFSNPKNEFNIGNAACKVAEVICVSNTNANDDLAQIEKYLSQKYGIGLN